MTTSTNALRFRLDNVRIAFPNLFKGQQFNGEGKFRCGASLLIPNDHPQLKQVQAAITQAIHDKCKGDKKLIDAFTKAMNSKDKNCLRDGDLKPKYDGFPGNLYLSANCAGGDTEAECKKPTVLDAGRNKVTDAGKSPIYAGCYVNALVEFYADDRFGQAVNCSLAGVQFRADGDAFGGGAPASEDDFEDVSEGAGAEDFA